MGLDSIWHWIILLVIVLAIFGTRKLTKIGPDLGRAVHEFKKALSSDDSADKDGKKDHEEVLQADPKPQPAAAESATAQQARESAEASQSK